MEVARPQAGGGATPMTPKKGRIGSVRPQDSVAVNASVSMGMSR